MDENWLDFDSLIIDSLEWEEPPTVKKQDARYPCIRCNIYLETEQDFICHHTAHCTLPQITVKTLSKHAIRLRLSRLKLKRILAKRSKIRPIPTVPTGDTSPNIDQIAAQIAKEHSYCKLLGKTISKRIYKKRVTKTNKADKAVPTEIKEKSRPLSPAADKHRPSIRPISIDRLMEPKKDNQPSTIADKELSESNASKLNKTKEQILSILKKNNQPPKEVDPKALLANYFRNEITIQCDHCESTFASLSTFFRHQSKFHSIPYKIGKESYQQTNIFVCTNCRMWFCSRQALSQHRIKCDASIKSNKTSMAIPAKAIEAV